MLICRNAEGVHTWSEKSWEPLHYAHVGKSFFYPPRRTRCDITIEIRSRKREILSAVCVLATQLHIKGFIAAQP